MVTNSLPADIRLRTTSLVRQQEQASGSGRSPHQSRNKPRAGISRQLHLGGFGALILDRSCEKLIAVLMIQVAPSASGAYQSAFRNLDLRCVTHPRRASFRCVDATCGRQHGKRSPICWQILFWTSNEFPRPTCANPSDWAFKLPQSMARFT